MSAKDLRPAMREFLLGDAALSAKVGGARIYPSILPQGVTDDSIVYTRISAQGDHHTTGASGLAHPRMQIDCYALRSDNAVALANAVKDRMDGYSGIMGGGGAAVEVQGVFLDTERDGYESDTKLHRVSLDFMIWYEER